VLLPLGNLEAFIKDCNVRKRQRKGRKRTRKDDIKIPVEFQPAFSISLVNGVLIHWEPMENLI
jgi:hypothetical protein